jgi:hypothetical protein
MARTQVAKIPSELKRELKFLALENDTNMTTLIKDELRKLYIEHGIPTI